MLFFSCALEKRKATAPPTTESVKISYVYFFFWTMSVIICCFSIFTFLVIKKHILGFNIKKWSINIIYSKINNPCIFIFSASRSRQWSGSIMRNHQIQRKDDYGSIQKKNKTTPFNKHLIIILLTIINKLLLKEKKCAWKNKTWWRRRERSTFWIWVIFFFLR